MRPERYLVEVEHEEETLSCARAVEVLLQSGSHFLTHADWGCKDGEHKAWLVVEAESREEVLLVVPPAFRSRAKARRLNSFSLEKVEDILRYHVPSGPSPQARAGEGGHAPNSAGLSASR